MGFTTKISGVSKRIPGSTLRYAIGCRRRTFGLALLLVVSAWNCSFAAADFPARAKHDFQSAMEAWRGNATNVTGAVAVARAAFLYAEFPMDDEQRADVARRGIEAGREALAAQPANAAAHYWLGMDLGQLARTKSLGALPLIKEIADEFQRARELDEKVDSAGPDRSLGLLYRDAPGWPASIGDHKKARQYLERAVEVSPEFPENQLCLLESYEKWGERTNFDRQMRVAEKVMAEAHTKYTGPEWESNWAEWNRRFEQMKRKSASVGRMTHPKGAHQ